MLLPEQYIPPTDLDELVFAATVPEDHYLRRVAEAVDFSRCRDLMATVYCSALGRPAVEPLLLLKLEFLQYHYNLSDRGVVEQTRYNMAYRWFLGLSLKSLLPHHTLLTHFRQRLGWEKHQEIFDALVAQARAKGLVKDRLRLKDATHIIANIAIPSTIGLVAQTRKRLLQALRPWAPERVAEEEQHALQVRTVTADLSNDERLLQRVVHLRAVVAWADEVQDSPAFREAAAAQQQPLREALQAAHQLLADRDDPKGKQPLRSAVDPDARRLQHGGWHTGYFLDVAMDADSEIITALNVLPGGSNEGADVTTLLSHEESVHGNDVQAVSQDGAGFQGPLLRELTDPAGLNVEVFVPPAKPKITERPGFTAAQFTLDATQTTLTCPAGQRTQKRRRNWKDHAMTYRFARATCAACPLRAQCVPNLPLATGRTVTKNDYEVEYQAVRAKAQTAEYAAVRHQHRTIIERKLGEMVRWHRCRRARYWGQWRVLLQGLLTAVVVNVKRMTRLLVPDPGGGGAVRAGWVGEG